MVWARGSGAVLFAAVFVLAALLAFFAPLGLAPLAALAGLACLPAPRAPLPKGAAVGFGVLFLWAGVSLAWSPARPWLGAGSLLSAIEHVTLAELVGLCVLAALAVRAALALTPAEAALPASALRWSVLGLAVLLVVESAERGWLYGALARSLQPGETADRVRIYAARGGYVLAVFTWPWLCTLSGRGRWFASAPFLAALGVCGLLGQDAPLAAVVVGAAAFALAFTAGRTGVAVLGAAQAAFWLGAPWAVRLAETIAPPGRLPLKPSWSARLQIWRFAVDRIAEHPWRGWGMDAARAFGDRIPLHAHNWSLQLWLELGLPGVIVVTALWLGLLRRVATIQDRFQRAAAAAGISAYLAIGAVSFGLWQAWWLAAGVLAALGAIVAARSAARS